MNENLKKLQDDILDDYNKNKISKREMRNILKWTQKSDIREEGNNIGFQEKYTHEDN